MAEYDCFQMLIKNNNIIYMYYYSKQYIIN